MPLSASSSFREPPIQDVGTQFGHLNSALFMFFLKEKRALLPALLRSRPLRENLTCTRRRSRRDTSDSREDLGRSLSMTFSEQACQLGSSLSIPAKEKGPFPDNSGQE